MGVRTDIQAKLIALFKVKEYEVVEYDSDGIPSVTGEKITPRVLCNDVSAIMQAEAGHVVTQTLSGWVFDLILTFEQEVDYSDYILSLNNLSYAYSNDLSVIMAIGNSILVTHPVMQGAHNGTELRFNINVKLKK